MISHLNDRLRQILKIVVDAYVATGEPVGSVAVARKLGLGLSPATIRNAMAELEERGLLYAPHTSAGRLPTDSGLAVFVEGLMEMDSLDAADKAAIDRSLDAARAEGPSINGLLEAASGFLSGLSAGAGLVLAPTQDDALRQVEFVRLAPGRVLAVLVGMSGHVENRLMTTDAAIDAATLTRAANYINHRLAQAPTGRALGGAADDIRASLADDRAQFDQLTARMIDQGIAILARGDASPGPGHVFIKGQSKLLSDVTALEDLERIRQLLDALETKETMLKILQAASDAEGVRIFIGADNPLFGHSGCSLIVAPYRNAATQIVGAVGVIGPTRLNYGRIIPVINYTSELIGKHLG